MKGDRTWKFVTLPMRVDIPHAVTRWRLTDRKFTMPRLTVDRPTDSVPGAGHLAKITDDPRPVIVRCRWQIASLWPLMCSDWSQTFNQCKVTDHTWDDLTDHQPVTLEMDGDRSQACRHEIHGDRSDHKPMMRGDRSDHKPDVWWQIRSQVYDAVTDQSK